METDYQPRFIDYSSCVNVRAFKHFWTLLIILGLIVIGDAVGQRVVDTMEKVPTIECKWASGSPTIDGRLDDLCWEEANWVGGFDLENIGGVPRHDTKVLAVYDEENLYIAFICYDDMNNLSEDVHFRRDGFVWRDDCVEVFMDVDHDHYDYYHIIANRSCVRYDEIGKIRPKSWDSEWRVGVGYASDFWTVEIAVPFKDLRSPSYSMPSPTPIPGETWGINFCRDHHSVPEYSSWTQSHRTFHQPRNFGHIVFMPFL